MRVAVPFLVSSLMIIFSSVNGVPNDLANRIRFDLTMVWKSKNVPELKMKEYAVAVGKALSKSPVPNTINNLLGLGDALYSGDKEVFPDKNFISLKKYAENNNINPEKLAMSFENMKVNQLKLMAKSMEKTLTPQRVAQMYGPVAMEATFASETSVSLKLQLNELLENGPNFKADTSERVKLPEIREWATAEYLIEKGPTTPLTEMLLKKVLTDPNYSKVGQYVDAALKRLEVRQKLKPVFESLAQEPGTIFSTWDNALRYGFDEVSSSLIENVPSDKLQVHLKTHGQRGVMLLTDGQYKFGVLTKMPTTQAVLFLDLMLNNRMEKTMSSIMEVRKLPGNSKVMFATSDLEKFINEKTPFEREVYLDRVKMAIDCIPREELTSAMTKTVMEGNGLQNLEMLEYFKAKGAIPSAINVEGKTLVHMALEQGHSLETLKFVVEKLRVPIADSPTAKSLLITHLDTNPMNLLGISDFWQKSQYLTMQGDMEIPLQSQIESTKNVEIPSALKNDPSVKIITGEASVAEMQSILETKSISELVKELPSAARTYRRNEVLSKYNTDIFGNLNSKNNGKQLGISMTEIFLKYRNLGPLTPAEQSAYESTIRHLMQEAFKDNNNLSPNQKKNIAQLLRDNIASPEDVKFTRDLLNDEIIKEGVKSSKLLSLQTELSETNKFLNEPTGKSHKRGYTLKDQFKITREILYETRNPLLTLEQQPTTGAAAQDKVPAESVSLSDPCGFM